MSTSAFNLTPTEKRASIWLAALYSLRLFGLFSLIPIFSAYLIRHFPQDIHTPIISIFSHPITAFSVTLGAYGLMQCLLQIPLGMLSDKIGRKKVIYAGLSLFVLGSLLASWQDNIYWIMAGRALQGAGAISAAITALLADLTREEVRTRSMAIIGGSIGITFTLSFILGPILESQIGLQGIFLITALFGAAGMLCVWKIIPNPKISRFHADSGSSKQWLPIVLKNPQLLRLNFGVFALHSTLTTAFIAIPIIQMQTLHLSHQEMGLFYLAILSISLVVMVPCIIYAEKRHQLKRVFCSAIALLLISQIACLWLTPSSTHLFIFLTLFFIGFNVLEASLPSLISKIAPSAAKGTAMGVYNTMQSLGLFLGGAIGGWIYEQSKNGAQSIFIMGCVTLTIWLTLAISMRTPQPVKNIVLHLADDWQKDIQVTQQQLLQISGVQEAMILIEERAVYLKVLQQGTDLAAIETLLNPPSSV